jgi:hypothetical protein
MTDNRTPNIVIADEAEISRNAALKREERLILAYQLAGLLHRLGLSGDVLDESEIDHLVQELECGQSGSAPAGAKNARALVRSFKKAC